MINTFGKTPGLFSNIFFKGSCAKFIVRVILLSIFLSGGLLLPGCDRKRQSALPSVPEVAVVILRPQQTVLTIELPGRTSAYLVAEIRSQVNGLIQKRPFTEGSEVNAGQVLYQRYPAPFQAALDNTKAARKIAVAQ